MAEQLGLESLERRSLFSTAGSVADATLSTPGEGGHAVSCGCSSCASAATTPALTVAVDWSPTEARVDPLLKVRGVESFWRPLVEVPKRASAAAVKLTRKIALAEAASAVANDVLATAARSTAPATPNATTANASTSAAGETDTSVPAATEEAPVSFAQAALTSDAGAIPVIKARAMSPFRLDLAGLRNRLANAPTEAQVLQTTASRRAPLVISLPAPGGNFERFEVWRTPVAAPEVLKAARMQTYAGRSLDDPGRTVRFDVSPRGLRAMTYGGEGGTYYIDPIYHGDATSFASYWRTDVLRAEDDAAWRCFVEAPNVDVTGDGTNPDDGSGNETSGGLLPSAITEDGVAQSGTILRTYRMAVAATGEYTTFHGGATQALAAIVTSVNRISGLYERDLSIRFTLVASNASLIYANSGTDPFDNTATSAQLTIVDNTIDSVIGSANYDVGHLFATSSGGIAQLNSVGGTSKGRGISGSPSPVGDAYDIDYVAHEVGHQFGGNHTFANCNGSNAGTSVDMEPGSGVTIMAYAGICGSTNLQNNSDVMFHSASIGEIIAFVDGTGSTANIPSQRVATGNAVPDVNVAATTYTIPARTPFELVATGSDANAGDTLTYSWEQRDQATGATAVNNASGTSGPLIRTFNPTTSPNRIVPRLSNLLANTAATGENLPTAGRTLNFRVSVRDNRSGGGAIAYSDTALTVVANTAGFAVTVPNTAVSWNRGLPQTVTWNTIGTQTNAAMGATNVRISLSTDGGNTWPIVLAESTPNDGSQSVTIPSTVAATSTARIRVQPTGNIFFDISNANFTLTNPAAPAAPTLAAASDTGTSNSDRITRLKNTADASKLTFTATGVTSGNTVRLYAGATLVGQAVATSATVDIATDGVTVLPEGNVQFRVEQVFPNGVVSPQSAFTTVTIDSVAPVAVFGITPTVRNTPVSSAPLTFGESVVGVDATGLALTRDGVSVGLAGVTVSGAGASYSVDGLNTLTSSTADYLLSYPAAGVTDIAGNPVAAPASLAFAHNVINLDPGTNTVRLRVDAATPGNVAVFVNNTTATPTYNWIFTAGQELRVDSAAAGAGIDTLRFEGPVGGGTYNVAPRFVTSGGLDRIEAARGTFRVTTDLGSDIELAATAGGRALIQVPQTVRALTVEDHGTVAYSAGIGAAVFASQAAIAVAPLGYLDLADNTLVVRSGDTAVLREFARRFVASTPAAPRGVGSSLTAPGFAAATRPAVFPNNVAPGVGFFDTFSGVALTSNDVLIAPLALTGDTDLSGSVTGADLRRLIEGFSTGRTGWLYGDLDHNGVVDTTDISIYRTVNG